MAVLVAAGLPLVLVGFTIGQLAHGVAEIHRHWWSGVARAEEARPGR